jgi:hypothetical protein
MDSDAMKQAYLRAMEYPPNDWAPPSGQYYKPPKNDFKVIINEDRFFVAVSHMNTYRVIAEAYSSDDARRIVRLLNENEQ